MKSNAPPLRAELALVQRQLAALLSNPDPDPALAWPSLVESVARQTRTLVNRDTDALLYLLVQETHLPQAQYSSQHALFCAVAVELCCQTLQLADPQALSALQAALTMNISAAQLQNELTHRDRTPTLDQRQAIDSHPRASVKMLRDTGVADELWLEIVALHHTDAPADLAYTAMSPAQQLATLLRRVDVYTAKLSARHVRPGMSAPLAARDACLRADGRPDEVGAAVLKGFGLYPPGSYVKLANGETAVVVKRAEKANQPRVISLLDASAQMLKAATQRDTAEPAFAVVGTAKAADIRLPTTLLQALGSR